MEETGNTNPTNLHSVILAFSHTGLIGFSNLRETIYERGERDLQQGQPLFAIKTQEGLLIPKCQNSSSLTEQGVYIWGSWVPKNEEAGSYLFWDQVIYLSLESLVRLVFV